MQTARFNSNKVLNSRDKKTVPWYGFFTRGKSLCPEEISINLRRTIVITDNNYYLWLEHDAHNEIITVERTEKGVRLKEVFRCEDLLK